MIAVARLNLNDEEMQELEELITKYEGSFATKDIDYRRTERVYHGIDAGELRPIRQPPRRLILEMLGDMCQHGVIEDSKSPSVFYCCCMFTMLFPSNGSRSVMSHYR
jgi:hypothetical protein